MPFPMVPAPTTPMRVIVCCILSHALRTALHGERHAVAAAEAQRRDAAPRVPALHRVEQRRQDPRAARADWMAERDRAAVDVDPRRVDAQLAHDGDRLHREGLVDLEQIDVGQLPADLRGDLPHRFDRRHHHHLRREAARRLADDARHRRQCRARGAVSADITTSAAAPSLTPGALPAVTVPSFLNAGFSAPSASAVVSSRIGSSRSTTSG